MNLATKLLLLSPNPYAKIARMFASGDKGLWYDPTDITTLFQDIAGTTPVTASGQFVGMMLDKSGGGKHATAATDAKRPVYTVEGSRKFLLANGSTQCMVTPVLNFPTSARAAVVAGLRRLSSATGIVCELGTSTASANGAFALTVGNTSEAYGTALRGTVSQAYYLPSADPSPKTDVCAVQFDMSAATLAEQIRPFVNGVLTQTGGSGLTTAGNLGTTLPMHLMSRAGTSLFFNGEFHGLVVNARPNGVSDADLRIMQRWVSLNSRAT